VLALVAWAEENCLVIEAARERFEERNANSVGAPLEFHEEQQSIRALRFPGLQEGMIAPSSRPVDTPQARFARTPQRAHV
jgi:hypothetical protein